MKFLATRIAGAYVIELEPHCDDRGFFIRTFCQREFEEHGLPGHFVQCNLSFSARAGTLRGMHYQTAPFAEAKLVRCVAGAIYDVLVDIRPDSGTYGQWLGETLSADNQRMLYIPEGCAHGFLTLADNTEVSYQMSNFYRPDHACGFRWDDPRFAIPWPREPAVMALRDRTYPDFASAETAQQPLASVHATL
jgi:dTDP-4-dehydrorhamnose 3,5-epimerase